MIDPKKEFHDMLIMLKDKTEVEDIAALLGTTKNRVYHWRGKNPIYWPKERKAAVYLDILLEHYTAPNREMPVKSEIKVDSQCNVSKVIINSGPLVGAIFYIAAKREKILKRIDELECQINKLSKELAGYKELDSQLEEATSTLRKLNESAG